MVTAMPEKRLISSFQASYLCARAISPSSRAVMKEAHACGASAPLSPPEQKQGRLTSFEQVTLVAPQTYADFTRRNPPVQNTGAVDGPVDEDLCEWHTGCDVHADY